MENVGAFSTLSTIHKVIFELPRDISKNYTKNRFFFCPGIGKEIEHFFFNYVRYSYCDIGVFPAIYDL